ncbi:LysM domain-containing protein [Podospora didyma]|uniref:LysM domain-containing protein n=1 Tax=Podospora didyma TaxID=330526 RepID=A0AAE0U8L5_9PEZI|nr:LysM domain-containing protein [Podospora didyma]
MRPIVFLLFSPLFASAVQLFLAPGDIPAAVPAKCRAALAQNITCSPLLITGQKAANGDYLTGKDLETYCSTGCSSSITTFAKNVEAGCGNASFALFPNTTTTQFPKNIANGIAWAYNLVCIKDGTGLCIADFYQNKKTDCSDCALKYDAVMLSSDYGRVRFRPDQFSAILSSCSVPASKYPWSYTPTQGATTTSVSTTAAPARTCAGTLYKAKQGDTCESISKVNSVATDRMIDLNNLDYKCKTLKPGATVCIEDQCRTLVVQKNQTCDSISKGQAFNVGHLQSWNPTSTMFSSWTSGAIVTNPPDTSTSWYYRSYATNWTVPVSSATVDPAKNQHIEDLRKYCWITEEDLEHLVNPEDFPGACQPLLSTYCYPDPTVSATPTASPKIPAVCTPDRSEYSIVPPPKPVPTPLPHQPNMTKGCYLFYKVVANDGCAAIAKANNIALDDFYKWNPDVKTDCKGLQAGTYVCIAFDQRLVG